MKKIAIWGKGQLGRMLALAGYPLGLRFGFVETTAPGEHCFTYTLEPDLSHMKVWKGEEATEKLLEWADVMTFENENVDLEAVRPCLEKCPGYPSPESLAISSDRVQEKNLIQSLGIETAPYRVVQKRSDLSTVVQELGYPFILKTTRFGYDGKGQHRIESAEDLPKAEGLDFTQPWIAEGFVRFDRELSIIAVRSVTGETAFYDLAENHHEAGILRQSWVGSPIVAEHTQRAAETIVQTLFDRLNYVGVMGVELFEVDGKLLVNEIAPRVHNTGHWTIEGAVTSQFENHLRAILGWPLGDTALRQPACAMVNAIGAFPDLSTLSVEADTYWHDYGKSHRAHRKVGHVTLLASDWGELEHRVRLVESTLEAVSAELSR